MDRGVILQAGFTVRPGQNGSFVLTAIHAGGDYACADVWGFSSADDLLAFLMDEADALKSCAAAEAQAKQSPPEH
jgi:hypothetical protein